MPGEAVCCTGLHCTTVSAGGGDRLWFRSTAGRMPAAALFEPSQ